MSLYEYSPRKTSKLKKRTQHSKSQMQTWNCVTLAHAHLSSKYRRETHTQWLFSCAAAGRDLCTPHEAPVTNQSTLFICKSTLTYSVRNLKDLGGKSSELSHCSLYLGRPLLSVYRVYSHKSSTARFTQLEVLQSCKFILRV